MVGKSSFWTNFIYEVACAAKDGYGTLMSFRSHELSVVEGALGALCPTQTEASWIFWTRKPLCCCSNIFFLQREEVTPWKKHDSPALLQTVAMRDLFSYHLQCHGWIKENEENWPEQIGNEQEEKPVWLLPARSVNWTSHCWRMTFSFGKTHRRLLLVHSFPRGFFGNPYSDQKTVSESVQHLTKSNSTISEWVPHWIAAWYL